MRSLNGVYLALWAFLPQSSIAVTSIILKSVEESLPAFTGNITSGQIILSTKLLKRLHRELEDRSLQGNLVCTNPGTNQFVRENLGAAADENSRYRNFGLPVVLSDGSQATYRIPIDQLADAFNKFFLQDNNVFPPFRQEDEEFGNNGQYTQEMFFQNQLATEFWKLEGYPPVVISAVYGDILAEETGTVMAFAIARWLRTQPQLQEILPTLPNEVFENLAQEAKSIIETELPRAYSNPLLSFNAYATPFLPVSGFPDSSLIVIGDGFLDYLASLGLGMVTNDILHAHEFGHVLQFIIWSEEVNGDQAQLFETYFNNKTPEMSRAIELTADAYASYFLAHQQGRNFGIGALQQAATAFFSIGDCLFENSNHHGTPEQRECSSLWGAQLALNGAGSDPIGFRDFDTLFQQNLPSILADDFSVCVSEMLSAPVPTPGTTTGPPVATSPPSITPTPPLNPIVDIAAPTVTSGSSSNCVAPVGVAGAVVLSMWML